MDRDGFYVTGPASMHSADRILSCFYVGHSISAKGASTKSSVDHSRSVALIAIAGVILTDLWILTSIVSPYQQYVVPLLACQPALDFLYPYLVESCRADRA